MSAIPNCKDWDWYMAPKEPRDNGQRLDSTDYMPDTVLSTKLIYSPQQLYKAGTTIITNPILLRAD